MNENLELRPVQMSGRVHIMGQTAQYIDFSGYRYSHYKDEMVVRPWYLYNGNPYTGKTVYIETKFQNSLYAGYFIGGWAK